MTAQSSSTSPHKKRWLLGLEPFFEGGWFHKGKRAKDWDVEENLRALSLLGDVCVDLSSTKSLPAIVELHAYAIGRDVDVLVPSGTSVQLTGRAHNDHLRCDAPDVAVEDRTHSLKVVGHTLLGVVTVRAQNKSS